MATRRRATVLAVAVCSAVVLAGCGSSAGGDSVDNGVPAVQATLTPSTPEPATSEPSQPEPSDSITPSSDVAATVPLATWVAAVCTSAGGFADKAAGISKSVSADPAKAGANLIELFTSLGSELGAMADQLEQLGAPDVENGKEFTDKWIDAARAMSSVYTQAARSIPKKASPADAMAAYAKAFNSGKAKAALEQFRDASELLNDSEFKAVVKNTPECAKLDALAD